MPPPIKSTSVLLVKEDSPIRDGIRKVLRELDDVQIIGEADSGRKAIQYVRLEKPHVVVMNLGTAQIEAVQAARVIKEEDPETVIIGLSIGDAEAMLNLLRHADATSYFDETCIMDDLYPVMARCVEESATGFH